MTPHWQANPSFTEHVAKALPSLFKDALQRGHKRTQAPQELIFASALGAASLVCQEHFDVVRPTGNSSPLSLYLLTIAESGERKTTVDNCFQAVVQRYESGQATKRDLEALDPNADPAVKKVLEQRVIGKITDALEKDDVDNLLEQVLELRAVRVGPQRNSRGRMVYMNTTLEALLEAMSKTKYAVGLISDEGGLIFDSRVSQHLASLNVLWEGGRINVDRVSKPSFQIFDSRLAVSVLSQPGVFRKFIRKRNDEARDLGFLARALTCFPASTQGERTILAFTQDDPLSWPFSKRLGKILELRKQPARIKLHMDESASSLWLNFAQEVEFNLGGSGYFREVRDFGSKLADNVSRIAAIFELMSNEGNPEYITLNSVYSAIQVGRWYAYEFVRLFGGAWEISEDYELAHKLIAFLNEQARIKYLPDRWYKTSDLLVFGPNKIRRARILNDVLNYAGLNGLVEISYRGKIRFVRVKQLHAPMETGSI